MYYVETSIGVVTGIILFMLWQGIDIVPVLFVITLIGAAVYLKML